MSEVLTKSRDNLEKLAPEVRRVWSNWQEAKRYHKPNLDVTIENWRFYFAKHPELGLGQYKQKVVDQYLQQERQLLQYNFILPTVDTLAGSLMQIPFEPDFIPTNGPITDITRAAKKTMVSDREIMDWKSPYLEMVRAGLVGGGDIKVVVSDRYNKTGNIGLEYQLPGSVTYDPMWKTWNTKDCRRLWRETFYTPEDMVDNWPNMKDEIKLAVEKQKLDGTTYGAFTGIVPFRITSSTWGSAHSVIEEYYVIKKKVRRDYVLTGDGQGGAKTVNIPDNIPDDNRGEWLDANVPGWLEEHVYSEFDTERVSKVKTIVPSLLIDDMLEVGETEVQIGATPFKHWAATRANGEDHSIVDSVKDPQQNINFFESLIAQKVKTEGGGGAGFTNSDMFVDWNEYLKFTKYRNRPSMNFRLKPGFMEKGHVPWAPIVKSGFPNEAFKNIEHIINSVWPHVSKVTPSSLGLQESRDVSGRLFNMLKTQSDLQAFTIHYGLRQFWNEVYEAYLFQFGETYSNQDLMREFPVDGGNDMVTLNKPIETGNGEQGIENDVSKIKEMRHKVVISEKQETPSQNAEDIEVMSSIVKNMPQSRFASINFLTNEIFQKMPNFETEAKEKLGVIGDAELQRDMAVLTAETAEAEARTIIANATAQNGGQPPPEPGTETGGQAPGPQGAEETPEDSLNKLSQSPQVIEGES